MVKVRITLQCFVPLHEGMFEEQVCGDECESVEGFMERTVEMAVVPRQKEIICFDDEYESALRVTDVFHNVQRQLVELHCICSYNIVNAIIAYLDDPNSW